MNPRVLLLLDIVRLVGLLGRAVAEGNTQDYILHLHAIERTCATAIRSTTFRLSLPDIEEDDDL